MGKFRLHWKVLLLAPIAGAALVGVLGIARGTGNSQKPAKTSATSTMSMLDPPPVSITVTKLTPSPGHYVYRYVVVNGSAFPITDILIGRDLYSGTDELSYAPMGWDGETVPATSFKGPPGWAFKNVAAAEDSVGHLQWSIGHPGDHVLGGSSVGGFEVTLDEVDQTYETGHWTVYLDTSEEPAYSGTLQASGVTGVPISSVFAMSDLRVKPNPAKVPVSIEFNVPTAGPTSVAVFDAQGRLVRRVLGRQAAKGNSLATWDGRDEAGKEVAAGVYFVRVKTPSTTRFARITWLH